MGCLRATAYGAMFFTECECPDAQTSCLARPDTSVSKMVAPPRQQHEADAMVQSSSGSAILPGVCEERAPSEA